VPIDSPCECEQNNPDSLDANGQRYHAREDVSSMVTADATANTTEGNSRACRELGLLCSHSHGESIGASRLIFFACVRKWRLSV